MSNVITELHLQGDAIVDMPESTVPQTESGPQWHALSSPYARVFHVALRHLNEADAYCAYCIELPGAVTEADDESSALRQITELFWVLVREYRNSGTAVPWLARDREEGDRIVSTITLDG